MQYSIKFSMTSQTENLLTETSEFLKRIFFLSSFANILNPNKAVDNEPGSPGSILIAL